MSGPRTPGPATSSCYRACHLVVWLCTFYEHSFWYLFWYWINSKWSVCPPVRFQDINTLQVHQLKLPWLESCWYLQILSWREREGKLKILNYILARDSYPALEFSNSVSISTIIGFQILTELFMTWNGKMKSLAEFNINKKKYLKSFTQSVTTYKFYNWLSI